MNGINNVVKMKELIVRINKADEAYYKNDEPLMSDFEYDALCIELKKLEEETGIAFANSPSRKVGGENKEGLKQVKHTKPMLSAKKTKSKDDIVSFAAGKDVLFSWKLDGLTIVLKYEKGKLTQALTRGENGCIGEDITHNVRYMRNIPLTVDCKDRFEVRGEGIVSWIDFKIICRNTENRHPRNVAAGIVRALTPNKGLLAHLDFIAFELIMPGDKSKSKEEQLEFLSINGFTTVDYIRRENVSKDEVLSVINIYKPEGYMYPVDGIIVEYNDIEYGKSLGATSHHENRMLALKWEDEEYRTTFRGVELSTTRNGIVSIIAEFDPVLIDGTYVKGANLHSLGNFEKFEFGIGDTIKVYKANMIIPQISENETRSGSYILPKRCTCCGSKLEIKISDGGTKNLYCPNEECIARNAQKIARFCDSDAMNIDGLSASVLEELMSYGFVKNFADLYHIEKHRERIIAISGLGPTLYNKIISAVEKSRRCRLSQFLVGIGIPLMGPNNAREIDEYFLGSWTDFELAIKNNYRFSHIAGISDALNNNIYAWYNSESEQRLFRPLLQELTFVYEPTQVGTVGNPFYNANVVVTGTVNNMNRSEINELLKLIGANVTDTVTKNTTFLITGEHPEIQKISEAMKSNVAIITQSRLSDILGECQA